MYKIDDNNFNGYLTLSRACSFSSSDMFKSQSNPRQWLNPVQLTKCSTSIWNIISVSDPNCIPQPVSVSKFAESQLHHPAALIYRFNYLLAISQSQLSKLFSLLMSKKSTTLYNQSLINIIFTYRIWDQELGSINATRWRHWAYFS